MKSMRRWYLAGVGVALALPITAALAQAPVAGDPVAGRADAVK